MAINYGDGLSCSNGTGYGYGYGAGCGFPDGVNGSVVVAGGGFSDGFGDGFGDGRRRCS